MSELDIQGIPERLGAAAVDYIVIGVKIVGYEDLVALKEQAGRPADLEDLERLRQARGE